MSEGIGALSEREKETLRFLLVGHDAKSIALELGLSVHTVNERLRDARRKLGLSSSREAARVLAEAEHLGPNSLADKGFGVGVKAVPVPSITPPNQVATDGHFLAWLGGGMLVMSLIITALLLSSTSHFSEAPEMQRSPTSTALPSDLASPAVGSARAWIGLLDHQRWEESWDDAGALFRSQIGRARWASMVRGVRDPLGAVSSRTLQSATEKRSIGSGPPGQYLVLQFQTSFAHQIIAVETVTLAHESTGWKVIGYFIR
jgi:DNA-binding CsgD family transcriptional regulator